jgi:hypothetical protein
VQTTQALRENARPAPGDRPDPVLPRLVEQVVHSARLSLDGERAEVRLRLHPPSLGEIRVQAVMDDRLVTLRIQTESRVTKGLLESGLRDLREALTGQGVDVDRIQIQLALDFRGGQPGGRSLSWEEDPVGVIAPWPAPQAEPTSPAESHDDGRLDIRI